MGPEASGHGHKPQKTWEDGPQTIPVLREKAMIQTFLLAWASLAGGKDQRRPPDPASVLAGL